MNITKKEIQDKLNLSEFEYVKFVIDANKEHNLTFAFFELSDIDDPDGITADLYPDYEVIIENETFKVFWK